MAAAEYLDMDKDYQKLILKWMSAGHEVVHERKLFRHRVYKKTFPPETVITRDGLPFLTTSGHKLTVGDVFPERADLALDMDANVVNQDIFTKRYRDYLGWFGMTESSEIESEPVPDVSEYISRAEDTFSDSGGFIEVGFDARKPAEFEMTHHYDPRTDQFIEIAKTQEQMTSVLAAMLEKINEPRRGPGRPRLEE